MVYVCVCGKAHKVNMKEGVRCIGPGHSVYLSPEWFVLHGYAEQPRIQAAKKNKTDTNGQIGLF